MRSRSDLEGKHMMTNILKDRKRRYTVAHGLCVMFFALCALASPSWAATYYVDATNGKDSNDGLSLSSAWKTIAKVNSCNFQPGDNILFKRGETWTEQLTVPSGGTSDAPLIFAAYGNGAKPIIDGLGRDFAIHIHNKDYVTIENIHAKHGNRFGILVAHADNVTIQDCEVEQAQRANIQVGACDNILIRRCDSHHSLTEHGIYLDGLEQNGTDYPIIEHCDLHDNYGSAIQINGNGVYRVKDPIIRYNLLHHNGPNGNGIHDLASDGGQYYYNIIYANNPAGIKLDHDRNQDANGDFSSINAKVYNNTIIAQDYKYMTCVQVCEQSRGHFIKNNIIKARDPYLIKVESLGNATIDYNCYYASDPNNTYHWKGTEYSSFAAWQYGSGQDANAIESSPKFLDPTNYNFALQADSPCIDSGTKVNLSHDFLGVSVPQLESVDMGAYEYGGYQISAPKELQIIMTQQ